MSSSAHIVVFDDSNVGAVTSDYKRNSVKCGYKSVNGSRAFELSVNGGWKRGKTREKVEREKWKDISLSTFYFPPFTFY